MSRFFCAAPARGQCKDFLPTVDTANRPWPTWRRSARGVSRSGSAWPGRSQKDGLPSARGAEKIVSGSRSSTRAQRRGSLIAAPSNRGQKWTSNQYKALVGSPPCRSFAQSSPGLWITLFLPRPFLPSGESPFSARPQGTSADIGQRLSRAQARLRRARLRWPRSPRAGAGNRERAVSVGETVGIDVSDDAKCWSEWQDLNLRPPRPERGGPRHHLRRDIGSQKDPGYAAKMKCPKMACF
jgi:hypothetical protein